MIILASVADSSSSDVRCWESSNRGKENGFDSGKMAEGLRSEKWSRVEAGDKRIAAEICCMQSTQNMQLGRPPPVV
jgi:hypothetical protein